MKNKFIFRYHQESQLTFLRVIHNNFDEYHRWYLTDIKDKDMRSFELSGITLIPSKRNSTFRFKLPSNDLEKVTAFMNDMIPKGKLKISSKVTIQLEKIDFNELNEIEITLTGNVIHPVLMIFSTALNDLFEYLNNSVLEWYQEYLVCLFDMDSGELTYEYVKGSNKMDNVEMSGNLKDSNKYTVAIARVVSGNRDRASEVVNYASAQFIQAYKQGLIKNK